MANPPRHVKGGYIDPKKLPKGPNGRALCRQCQTETKPPRKTFCSDKCVDLWMVRTGSKMAQFIKKRDKGICAICGLDCEALKKELRALEKHYPHTPYPYPDATDYEPNGVSLTEGYRRRYAEHAAAEKQRRLEHREVVKAFKEKHGIPPTRTRFWDIDHILPVVEGGGSCDPSNLRVLCLKCHKQETSKLRARLYSTRYKERLEQKAAEKGWTFPKGLPALASDPVLVRCHKHLTDVGDPSVHQDGYYEWTPNSNTLSRDDRGCPHCSNRVPVSNLRAEWFALNAGYQLLENQTITSSQQLCSVICLTCNNEHIVRQLVNWRTGRDWVKISTRQIREITGEKAVPKEFDLFDPQTKTVIEVDGEFHRRSGFGELAAVQAKDADKEAFCLKVGWRLIRINTEELNRALRGSILVKWFNTVLQDSAMPPRSEFVLSPFTSDRATVNYNRCVQVAEARGGKILTQHFMGWKVPHEWLCSVHGPFMSTPNSVVSSSYWCKPCGYGKRRA